MSIISGLRSDKWRTVSSDIVGGGHFDADSVPLNLYAPTKYYVELKSVAESVFKAFELYGSRSGSDSVSDCVYARVGDAISTEAILEVVFGTVRLRLKNNETFPVSVRVTKLIN